ncbi:MAG: Glutathione-regulated potassium-efflux system protein KefC [Myxococcaceae bacterium]|nr:Glutathione-regulated potassium-efflux system protein KefC [Myxococcaceae bacterium]
MHHHSLLFDALIYLAAAVVCVPLASRFKLGSVLGYLAAGCLIGPHVLGLIQDVEAIMSFAELGVVLMLFVIGLELDPRRLWELRRSVFVGGALQLVCTTAALTVGGIALGLPWQAALISALALSLSSTAIAMQTMSERNLTNAPIGRAAFGVLLFQDLAAVPIIGLVPLLAPHGSSEPFQITDGLKGIAAILVVIGVGRYLTRPVLQFVARTGLRDVFTAFSLLLVLGIAQVMALAGLSMALGAFLAGVLLAGSEYRRALETDIEPFKGLLMGLFFIAVGMSIDFGLLAEKPLMVLLVLTGFQLLKAGSLIAIAPRLEVARTQRLLFGSLLAQGGEFAFVVFGVTRASEALPDHYEDLLTLVVALSMGLTPFLVLLRDKAAARTAGAQREDDVIENDGEKIIIAGFGRVGQIIGRLLYASGLRATVLDHDPDQIELLRRFGFRVFYGDATRADLLEAAGAGEATLLVNAIDDMEDSLELADLVREKWPKLTMIARARNVTHFLELRERGVEVIERETFEAALALGRRALQVLGRPPFEAQELSNRFKRHNIRTLELMSAHFNDEAERVSLAKAAREELEEQFERDREALRTSVGESKGWQLDGET